MEALDEQDRARTTKDRDLSNFPEEMLEMSTSNPNML